MQYILLIPKKDAGVRRFCFLAFGLAVLTLSKIANRKQFHHKDELKLSRKSVMTFYTFTKIAVGSDTLMKLFFHTASSALRRQL
jgi:farnesyl-diphosphate farnesyltransferase